MSAKTIINNTVALAKAARVFDVPVVPTTVETKGFSGNGYAPAGHFHDFTCLWGALGCACWAA